MVYVANTRLYLRSMSELDVQADSRHRRLPARGEIRSFRQMVDRLPSTPPPIRHSREIASHRRCRRDDLPGRRRRSASAGDRTASSSASAAKASCACPPNGGTPEVLVSVKDGEVAQGPQLLPGGQHVLFTLATGTASDRWDKARIVVQSLASGERKTLIEGGSDARYVPTGHLVYALGGSLFAVAFDLQRLEVSGGPVADGRGRQAIARRVTGAAQFSVSSNGSLVYIPGRSRPRRLSGDRPDRSHREGSNR